MKKNIKLFFICAFALLFASCGSEGGDSGNDSGTTESVTTELSTVDGYGLVSDIVTLDLNDDGYQDLLLFRTGDSYDGLYIQALINNGDQTFSDETDTYLPTLAEDYKWIEKAYLVDLNGDGLLDIVGHIDQVDSTSALPPLLRTASGAFEICSNAVFTNCGNMLPIDADADGDIDILQANISNTGDEDNQVIQWSLFENTTPADGDLTFTSLGVVSNDDYEGWDYTYFIYAPVVMDIDNDGYDDFIYGGPAWQDDFVDETTPLSTYTNSTLDSFSLSSEHVFNDSVPSYTHVREMVEGDFNNDGYEDILVANHGYDDTPFEGEHNAVLMNNGDGTFVEQTGDSTTHNYKGFTHSADVGDIDADGDLDIVYTDICGDDVDYSEEVKILTNDGNGNFSFSQFYADDNSSTWTSTKLVDLDNDGYVDLVLGSIASGSNSIVVWNNGSGEF